MKERRFTAASCLLAAAALVAAGRGRPAPAFEAATAGVEEALGAELAASVRPLLARTCVDCHNADTAESGVRIDDLAAFPGERTLPFWERLRKQVAQGAMPPEDAPQPSADERQALLGWLDRGIELARSRPVSRNGSVRRLTVAQYRHTIRELLGIEDDVAGSLPPDPVSRDGFTNQAAAMQFTPLQVEAFLAAADRALDAALVDPDEPPAIQRVRVELGRGVNPAPSPDHLILGHISQLLPTADVLVTEPELDKPFPCRRRPLQSHFRFIEGYQGNDTVREWREFTGLHHNVFACLRGSDGDDTRRFQDPRGRNAEVVADGLLLRPSIPGARFLGDGSKYGPLPNFKIALRDLPSHGAFRVTVRAARLADGLLVGPAAEVPTDRPAAAVAVAEGPDEAPACTLAEPGIYLVLVPLGGAAPRQFQADGTPPADAREVVLDVAGLHLAGPWFQPGFAVVRLPAGRVEVRARVFDVAQPDALSPGARTELAADAAGPVALVRLDPAEPLAARFAALEARVPRLGVHLGLRRDCGSTLAPVGEPQPVADTTLRDYAFTGAIANFPDPDVEPGNPNYLAGLREIAVRSEYTSDRDVPRLLVRAVEFEGPFVESWPPPSHRAIFDVPGAGSGAPRDRARAILAAFAGRAFRRPPTPAEEEGLLRIWEGAIARGDGFRDAVREALVAVLVAPQFLLLVESSAGPEGEPLDDDELASKLSYFLWNSPPDARLLDLAAGRRLRDELPTEVDRLVEDPRFSRFADSFAAEWLALHKFDVVETDRGRFPRLSAHAKPWLRQEPARLLEHLVRSDAPVSDLVASDEVVVNEVAADYYGLGGRVESGFSFVPVRHGRSDLGGLLTVPAVLAGLSNGREPDPVKRGAWVARKIVARPPPDPPPNVPKLEDLSQLSLRERLERHRSAPGCTACHLGIDPWGFPLEAYDAAGLRRTDAVDSSSTLPDGAAVADFDAFRARLREAWLDDIAFSFARHLATYACGRPPAPLEERALRERLADAAGRGIGLRDIVQAVVSSEMFLLK